MFRNVTGAQEAVVHRQSEDSLSHESSQNRIIKDVQSDNIAQTYSTLKDKWFQQREQLIEKLKKLEKRHAFAHEIQHVSELIGCLTELLETGEMTKNCQTSINGMNEKIQPLPETYILPKKPLGEKAIRLRRRTSKTTTDMNDLQINTEQQQTDETSDRDQKTASGTSTGQMKNGIQFYVVAENFRKENDTKKSGRKHYFASSVLE